MRIQVSFIFNFVFLEKIVGSPRVPHCCESVEMISISFKFILLVLSFFIWAASSRKPLGIFHRPWKDNTDER